VIFLFLLITAISLLIPSNIRISRAINIHGQKDSIFKLVGDTSNWKQWHPAFIPGDSAAKFPVIQIVSRSQNDSEIVMHLRQENKPKVINGWKIYTHQQVDSITLQWYMDFHLQWYPWKKFGSLFFENTYGAMMEQGLENLKGVMNK